MSSMTLRYTSVIQRLPQNKMRMYPTRVINIIGGPGCGKSLISAALMLHLNLHGKVVETTPDFAKLLVWQNTYEVLKNQYFIAQRQYEMLEMLDGQVPFLITECSLPQLLFYNANYPDNICDIGKTHDQILRWHQQFDNVNILVQRNDQKYVRSGRFQDEEEAVAIDHGLRTMLERERLPFTTLAPDVPAIQAFANALMA